MRRVSRPYKQAYQTYGAPPGQEAESLGEYLEEFVDSIVNMFQIPQAHADIGGIGKQTIYRVNGAGGTTGGPVSPRVDIGKNIQDFAKSFQDLFTNNFQNITTVQKAEGATGTIKPCTACDKGYQSRRNIFTGGCYCKAIAGGTTFDPAGNAPLSSGSSGNCSWDTKGGWCWNSSACGGRCRGCVSGYRTRVISSGCGKVRNYFVNNARRCPACVSGGGGTSGGTGGGTTGFKSGSSGNCSWDTSGGWCWKSSACGGTCRACISNYRTNSISSGCDRAKNYFINNSRKCPSCGGGGGTTGFKAGSSGNCSWDTKGGWCWSSSACGGKCKACISNYKTTSVSGGCGKVKSYFLNNAKSCPACKATTRCPYSGCTGLSKGSSCFYCRCSKLCSGKGGVKTVKSDGSCYCKGTSSSGGGGGGFKCPYSGCGGTGSWSQCYLCRCRGICNNAAHGGVKRVASNGSCYCNR